MPRLFVAIDLPAEVKASLARFSPELPSARWVGPQELHLTLRFIGEVGPEICSALRNSLCAIHSPSFPLTLRGVGHFPPGGHPRVLWAGIDPCEQLLKLQREIESALTGSGIPAEERPFSPHITLARLKVTGAGEVEAFEARHASLTYPCFEVDEFTLYSSILGRQGTIHCKEAVYPCQ